MKKLLLFTLGIPLLLSGCSSVHYDLTSAMRDGDGVNVYWKGSQYGETVGYRYDIPELEKICSLIASPSAKENHELIKQ